MAKTLFQKIIDREIPAKIEYEDSLCIVIHDIEPQAPVHRVIINNGPHACESVPHMHIHVLAKRQMTWPPG